MAERAGIGDAAGGFAGGPLPLLAAAAAALAAAPAGLALAGAAAPWAGAAVLAALVLLVTGLHLVAGVGGLPSLGHAGFAALGALAAAQAAARLGLPAPLALPFGGIAAALAGVVAAPVLCRLPAPAFAGATLALGALLALPAAHAPGLPASAGAAAVAGYATAAAFALAALLAAWWLGGGEVGAALCAAGDDPRTAAATGIDAPRLRRRLFVVGVALAGLGGGALAQGAAAGAGRLLDAGASLVLLAAVVAGGPGGLTGALGLGVPLGVAAVLLAPEAGAADWRLPLAGAAALAGLGLRRRFGAGRAAGPAQGNGGGMRA